MVQLYPVWFGYSGTLIIGYLKSIQFLSEGIISGRNVPGHLRLTGWCSTIMKTLAACCRRVHCSRICIDRIVAMTVMAPTGVVRNVPKTFGRAWF